MPGIRIHPWWGEMMIFKYLYCLIFLKKYLQYFWVFFRVGMRPRRAIKEQSPRRIQVVKCGDYAKGKGYCCFVGGKMAELLKMRGFSSRWTAWFRPILASCPKLRWQKAKKWQGKSTCVSMLKAQGTVPQWPTFKEHKPLKGEKEEEGVK